MSRFAERLSIRTQYLQCRYAYGNELTAVRTDTGVNPVMRVMTTVANHQLQE